MAILTNGPSGMKAPIGELITDGECKALHGLLKLLRSKKHPAWLESFLEGLTIHADADEKPDARAIGPKQIISQLLDSVNEIAGSAFVHAIMYLREGDKFTTIKPAEHEMMLRYLDLHRSGNWLADFFDMECTVFATGGRRTPEQVIRQLVGNELEEFECHIDTTRTMLEEHPEFFQAEIERLVPKPAEQEKTQGEAKARARKSGKGKKAA